MSYDFILGTKRPVADAINSASDPSALFKDADWSQVGNNKELTDFLTKSLDPDGSKYGGDIEALKTDILNNRTENASSITLSIKDAIGARTEDMYGKQFNNLLNRLYETAPNRLFSGDAGQAFQAVKSGVLGATVYDPAGMALNVVSLGGAKVAQIGGQAAKNVIAREGGDALLSGAAMGGADAAATLAQQAAREGMKQGAISGAAREAGIGAAGGFVGDIAQQDSEVQRGTRDEISLLDTAVNVGGGALLGGAMGGIEGAILGRGAGRRAAGDAVSQASAGVGPQRMAPGTEAEIDPATFDPTRTDYEGLNSQIQDATSDISEFLNEVITGKAKSQYNAEQIEAIRDAVVRAQNSQDMSEAFLKQALDLEAEGTPQSRAAANEARAQATRLQRFVDYMMRNEFGAGELVNATGDIDQGLVSVLSRYDQELAEALASKPPKAAAKGAKNSGAAPAAGRAPSAAGQTAPPADPSVSQVAAPTPEAAKAQQALADAGTPTMTAAQDVRAMADSFAPDEQDALRSLDETLAKANSDLDSALARMEQDGVQEVAKGIAVATGEPRAAITESLQKVTGAVARERSRRAAAAPAPAAELASAPAPAAEAAAPAAAATPAPAPAAAPGLEMPTAVTEALVADDAAAVAATKAGATDATEAQIAQVAADSGLQSHQTLVMRSMEQAKLGNDVIDRVVEAVAERTKAAKVEGGDMAKADKIAVARQVFDELAGGNEELKDILNDIGLETFLSKQGGEKAKAKLGTALRQGISWTYAKAIGDILPDPSNVGEFEAVLKLLRVGEDAASIVNDYRSMLLNAMADRVAAVGVDRARKEFPTAWNNLISGAGGTQIFGGNTKVKVEIGEMVNGYADRILSGLFAKGHKTILADMDKQLAEVGAIVRDYMKQLQQSGIPLDSQFMQEALQVRAEQAVDDAISGRFAELNKGDYDKMAAMRELREQDKQGAYQSSLRTMRGVVSNPILHRVTDEYGLDKFVVLTGRSQPRGDNGLRGMGKVSGALSDGISEYLGTLWAHPKKAFAAARMARRAIYGAAVENASWGKARMMVNGEMKSGSLKELKGLMAESVHERMLRARFSGIVDARRKLDAGDISDEQYRSRIADIGGRSGVDVQTYDEVIAQKFIDSEARIKAAYMVQRRAVSEILADADLDGDLAYQKVLDLLARVQSVAAKEDGNVYRAMKEYETKVQGFFGGKARDQNVIAPTGIRGKDGKPAKDSDGKNLKIGESKEAGSAAVEPKVGKERAEAEANAEKEDVSRDFLPSIVKVGSVSKEVKAADVIDLRTDGSLVVSGKTVGTWARKEGSSNFSVVAPGIDPQAVFSDRTSLLKSKSFRSAYGDSMAAKVKAAPAAPKALEGMPEGSQVPAEVSTTAALERAQGSATAGGVVSEADLGTMLDSFDIPDGRVLVFKRMETGRIEKLGLSAEQMRNTSLAQVMEKLRITNPSDIRLGSVPAGKLKKTGEVGKSTQDYMQAEFRTLGTDVAAPSPELLKKIAADGGEVVSIVAEAQRRPITGAEAAQIKADDGKTLMDVWLEFQGSSIGMQWPKTAALLRFRIAKMEEVAATLERLAPHGIKMPGASRRTSFTGLRNALAGVTEQELGLSLDVLRRLDLNGRSLPYFYAGADNSLGIEADGSDLIKGDITLSTSNGKSAPYWKAVHETGHWAFFNMLSPREQIEFARSLLKYTDLDGNIDPQLAVKGLGGAYEDVVAATGRGNNVAQRPNEIFAWQFSNYVHNRMLNPDDASMIDGFWESVLHKVKGLVARLMSRPVDPDLLPLFERIMPSKIGEKRYAYGGLYDQSTGAVRDLKDLANIPERKGVLPLVSIMEKMDGHRQNLAMALFTRGGLQDSGLAEQTRAAANYMFGVLYGRRDNAETSAIGKLRRTLSIKRNATGDDRWLRDADGKVVKGEDGRGVTKTVDIPGSIDPQQLFSRSSTGELMSRIRDMMPSTLDPEKADGIAFEAASGSEEVFAVLKANGLGDNPEVQTYYNQLLVQRAQENLGKGMSEADALDDAELFATKEVAAFAKEDFGIDLGATLFDATGAVKIGTKAQAEALGEVTRKLYDLITDAMESLEVDIGRYGLALQRNAEPVAPTQAEVDAQPVKAKKPRSAAAKVAPASARSAEVVKREASDEATGKTAGVPNGAPPLVKALIARVPHRDPEQQDIIGTMLYRVFSHLLGPDNIDNVTNADVARMADLDLEPGVAPEALASSSTKAFEYIRQVARRASEHLTNGKQDATQAAGLVADMLVGAKLADMREMGLSPSEVADEVRMILRGKSGSDSPEVQDMAAQILADTSDILSGLGKTAEARRALGDVEVEAPGAVKLSRLANGNLDPETARTEMTSVLRGLRQSQAAAMLSSIGVRAPVDLADVGSALGENLFFVTGKSGRKLLSSVIDAAGAEEGVRPVFVNREKLFDPAQLDGAASPTDNDLKALGFIGKLDADGNATIFSSKSSTSFEDLVELGQKTTPAFGQHEPMVAELTLYYNEAPIPDPLAVEQRALNAGATSGVAKVAAKLFKKNRSPDGLNEAEAVEVRKFSGIQLMENAARIAKAGGQWLADNIKPSEGTSFGDMLNVRLAGDLVPLVRSIDEMTGVTGWVKRSVNEIRRNVVSHTNGIPQSEAEEQIVLAMRRGDLSSLTAEQRGIAMQIDQSMKKMLEMQRQAGIAVGDVTGGKGFYLPQRLNIHWLTANRDDAIGRLARWMSKDSGDALDVARVRATKVIDNAINQEDLKGIVDGSSSTYAQAFGDSLYKRSLGITGKDWDYLAPLFDNNLKSMLISYSEMAHKRSFWSERFGVKGHAVNTYVAIAQDGTTSAIDALLGRAQGVATKMGDSNVEVVDELFRPFTANANEAAAIVTKIVKELKTRGTSLTVRQSLATGLSSLYGQRMGVDNKHFAKRAEAIVNGLADFGESGGKVSKGELDFMLRMTGVLGGRPAYTIQANEGIRNMARGLRTFNSVTLLSMTVLASLADAGLPLVRSGSMKSWMNGMRQGVLSTAKDPVYAAAMGRVGVGIESILNENIGGVSGGLSGRLSNAFFWANGLTVWTEKMRQVGALTGFEMIKANQSIVKAARDSGNIDNRRYRYAMRQLRQLGVGHLVGEPGLDDFVGATRDEKVAAAIHRFVQESVFQPDKNDVPLWAQDPIGGMFFQLKSFPVMMGRMVKRSFKEALATEDGKYAGDPTSLLYLATVGAALGMGTVYVKDVAQGRNEEAADGNWRSPRERSLSKVASELGFIEKDGSLPVGEDLDTLMGWYIEGLMSLGALGFIGDLFFQSAKQVDNGAFGRERIMSQLLGPTYGTFSDAIQVVEGGIDAATREDEDSNAKQRNAVRKIIGRVPGIGGQNELKEGWTDWVAGEKME